MKILHIVGARPQFIKYFPVSRAVEAHNASGGGPVADVLVHTGQHYDYRMSRVFFDEFGIREPEHHLGVGSGSHGAQTGEILRRAEGVLLEEGPDWVLVYGDTNSTLAGALAAAKLGISVAHVEAGLRSFNRRMPEEINRILTDRASTLLFCPSRAAADHLRREGFRNVAGDGDLLDPGGADGPVGASADDPAVLNVGDVMLDVLRFAVPLAAAKSRILEDLGLEEKSYRVLTLHRAENTDDPARFGELAGFVNGPGRDLPVIFPMHPRVKSSVPDAESRLGDHVRVVEPAGYFDMLTLVRHSAGVMTDSGGLQKEAYFLRVPCITLREETEWVETVESGWNVLYREYREGDRPRSEAPFYGDGHAAERIVRCLTAPG